MSRLRAHFNATLVKDKGLIPKANMPTVSTRSGGAVHARTRLEIHGRHFGNRPLDQKDQIGGVRPRVFIQKKQRKGPASGHGLLRH